VLVQVAYAGGLRISELVGLTWGNVIRRDDGKVQLNVLGKGSKPRQVLLREVVSNALLKLRGDAGDSDPIFANPAGGPLTDRAVNYMLTAAAKRAGLPGGFSAHWLRHAHASHAIDHGAALPRARRAGTTRGTSRRGWSASTSARTSAPRAGCGEFTQCIVR
jgi:site-specific recombinase XerD